MPSSIETRLKRIEKRIPRPPCWHPNGLIAPSDEDLAQVRQELADCGSCKGQRLLKVFTRTQVAEFENVLLERLKELEPAAQMRLLTAMAEITGGNEH
jgi:hypothetical protein